MKISELSYHEAHVTFYTLLASRAYRSTRQLNNPNDVRAKKFDKLACIFGLGDNSHDMYTQIYKTWASEGFRWPYLRFALFQLRKRMNELESGE